MNFYLQFLAILRIDLVSRNYKTSPLHGTVFYCSLKVLINISPEFLGHGTMHNGNQLSF